MRIQAMDRDFLYELLYVECAYAHEQGFNKVHLSPLSDKGMVLSQTSQKIQHLTRLHCIDF